MGRVSDEQDPLAGSPLFREIQRILLAGTGPINWELARQVGIATVAGSGDDPEPGDEGHRVLEEAVRLAEITVADLTGMPAPVLRVRTVRRAGWVEAEATGLRPVFEPLAARVAALLEEARREGPAQVPEGAPMLESMLGQLSPLLMGAQAGTVLGQLGRTTLSQYELPLPRHGEPGAVFVVPNIAAFETEWSVEPLELRTWVALHETAHAFALTRPWVADFVHGMVRELGEGMRFDLAGLEARLSGLDTSNPAALSEALGDPTELFGEEQSDERRLLIRRFQSFLAATEGHAEHVVERVGRERLPAFGRIQEAMRRRHEGRTEEERMVERLLGLPADDGPYRLGRAFCEHVAGATDEATLARMWGSADSLPSMPELEEPTLWLARMA
jgi:putative hydrolase